MIRYRVFVRTKISSVASSLLCSKGYISMTRSFSFRLRYTGIRWKRKMNRDQKLENCTGNFRVDLELACAMDFYDMTEQVSYL